MSKEKYASMYGPTVGDRFRLADTSLIAKIEKDYTTYGEESKFGGGKTIRDGMAQSPTAVEVADLIITNAIIKNSPIKIIETPIKNNIIL